MGRNISADKKAAERIGKKVMQNCGMEATVIKSDYVNDTTVRFSDGQIKEHIQYDAFLRGQVWPGNYKESLLERHRRERIGNKRTMNFGEECEIIKYDGARDVTVRFPDGTVVEKRLYSDFLKGEIKNPNINYDLKKRAERLNTRWKTNAGLWVTVIDYKGVCNVTVMFDDGAIVKDRMWECVISGEIAHPSVAPVLNGAGRVNEIREMNNGKLVQLVAYHAWDNVDLVFLEDGARVFHVYYDHFKNGVVAHPNKKCTNALSLQEFAISYYLSKFGFRKLEQGEWKDKGFGKMEIDFYHDGLNIGIEYDGAIHAMESCIKKDLYKNVKCEELGVTLYRLRDPNLSELDDEKSINYVLDYKNKIDNRLIDCKQELKSILNENGILFDDDDIDFKRDIDIILEEYRLKCINYKENQRVGEVGYSKCANQKMTIVAYYDAFNMTVEFEDHSKRTNVSYSNFKAGSVQHPDKTDEALAKSRLHEKNYTNEGLEVEIICYRKSSDIDVQYTCDGSIRRSVTYQSFLEGRIAHPQSKRRCVSGIEKNKNSI